MLWTGPEVRINYTENCPRCGSKSGWKMQHQKQMTADGFSPWRFYLCAKCGHKEIYNSRGEIRFPGKHCNAEIWAMFEQQAAGDIAPMFQNNQA